MPKTFKFNKLFYIHKPPSGRMKIDTAKTLENYLHPDTVIEAGRIHNGGQKIYPNYKEFQKSPEYQFMRLSERDFIANQKQAIIDLAEKPCRKMVSKLLDNGMETYWSNGFGSGHKGVWWKNPKNNNHYFTFLKDGKSFSVLPDKHRPLEVLIDKPYDPKIDFKKSLPTLEDFKI